MWMILGFGALGLLIGNLIGMTSEGVVGQLISLLFVFVGGSVLAFLHRLSPNDRRLAGGALFSLSVACILGLYAGIWVNEHRTLSLAGARSTQDKYVRGAYVSKATVIDSMKANGLPADEAYKQMYDLARSYEREKEAGK
jgi:hypothetical protein